MTTSDAVRRTNDSSRRPIAMRSKKWAHALARMLTRAGVSPNAISLSGLAFAVGAGSAFAAAGHADGSARVALLIAAAAGIQLRLLCNMMDGMVAIEGGRRTAHGELFNDAPDRLADIAVLVGAGYSLTAFAGGADLGWAAAVCAVLTAYVRLLGASMGTAHFFIGPMAKPHRMGTMAAAAVLGTCEPVVHLRGHVVAIALTIVIAGSIVTCVRRIRRIAAELSAR